VEPGSLVPGWLSHRTQCVDRKDGINSVDVKETGSLGESLYCIKGYKETDCEGEEIAFTYPWDSAQRGRSFLALKESSHLPYQEMEITLSR
jgi:hypothetical protein